MLFAEYKSLKFTFVLTFEQNYVELNRNKNHIDLFYFNGEFKNLYSNIGGEAYSM